MILVKNITKNTEMKVNTTIDSFVCGMKERGLPIAKSQTGRYLINVNGVLMRLDICEI